MSNQDQILAVYSVPPDYIEAVADAHAAQQGNFANPDFLPQWHSYLDGALKDASCVQPLEPYKQGYDGKINMGSGEVATKTRVFPSVVLPPLRVSRDVTAIASGQNPEGDYGGGGVIEFRPRDATIQSAFGFSPLEGHAIIAITSNAGRATAVVMARPNNSLMIFGTRKPIAFAAPKSELVKAIANASGFLNILQADACGVCSTPCSDGKACGPAAHPQP